MSPAVDQSVRTTTGSDGVYRLSGIKSTTFTVQFSHVSYQTFSFEYMFMLGTERLDLTTQLTPGALTPGALTPGSPTFTFDAGVSAEDQELIRQSIQLGQSYFPPAVGRGVIAATSITATLNPSPFGNQTAVANGHRIDIYINSQGWRTSTSIQKRKILVHEFFHVLQAENNWPGFGNTQGAIWLLEGAAEYVGYRAVIDNGLAGYNAVRDCHILSVTTGTPLPALSTLEGQGFGAAQGAVYSLGWLAVEKATQRNLGTLGLFWSSGSSWQTAFSSAFGVGLEQFYAAFEVDRRDYRAPTNNPCGGF